eukprot:m.125107 g.125107  ORF g.125107 m.125107 type:complete len:492 (-) comp16313_c3_seq1:290-1765(-)
MEFRAIRAMSTLRAVKLSSTLNPAPTSSRTFDVRNPATGAVIGQMTNHSVADVQQVIKAADAGWMEWRQRSAKDRAAVLRKWAALISSNSEYLAQLISSEGGKPVREARGEMTYANSFVSYFAEEAIRVDGDIIPANTSGQRILVLKQPVGVSACITPWNFPAAMITRKVAPALAVGCPVVIKPASETPFTAQALVELAVQAGVPRDVIGMVTCDEDNVANVGKELATNELVRKISFTGSTAVGKHLMALASGTVKRMSMELGGNAPFIVFDDADLDSAVEGVVDAIWFNQGQVCSAGSRLLVQEAVYERMIKKIKERMTHLRVGTSLDKGIDMGAIVDPSQRQTVLDYVEIARKEGADVYQAYECFPTDTNGWYHPPTLITNVSSTSTVVQEEIFGPIIVVMPFKTEEEVIARANGNQYGLAASIWTKDGSRAIRISESIMAGTVWVNCWMVRDLNMPFGGMKASGTGRESAEDSLDFFTEAKTVCIKYA